MAHEVTRHRISCDYYKSPPSPRSPPLGGFPFPPSSYDDGFPFAPTYNDGFPFPPSSYGYGGFTFPPSSYGGFPFPPSSPGPPSSYGSPCERFPFAPTYNGFPFPHSSYGSPDREYPVDLSFAGGFPPPQFGGSSSADQQIMGRSYEAPLGTLRDQLETNKAFSRECCIYRVPARLRELNEEAYTPRVVSIGPLHHGKDNLKAMEDHKIMYLQEFLRRSKVRVDDLIKIVRDNETKLRDCYAETIDLRIGEDINLSRGEDFARMILLDAVFVIMVLLLSTSANKSHKWSSGDQIFSRPYKFVDVVWDMCLLENQLPFVILEKLFELYPMTNCTVIELTSQFFKDRMKDWVNENTCKTINSEVLHFVDFIRKCQQPTEQSSEDRKTTILSAPPATKLHQSGVKFQHPERNSLFDVRFINGTLEIPQLTIHARTEILFRNLQAFEQCHYMFEDKFASDYITFISCLVRAPNDVEVLAHNENLKIMLNSNEAVSNILYNLDKENVVSENSFLRGVCEDLDSHCRKRRNEWKAILKQDYFKNPWTAISVVAATFLLVLTVTQTVFYPSIVINIKSLSVFSYLL